MNRKRSVTAATALSFALVVGSTAFALANGVFVTQPAPPAGNVAAIEARLAPETKGVAAPTVVRPASVDHEVHPVPSRVHAPVTEPNREPTAASPTGPISTPAIQPTDEAPHRSDNDSVDEQPEPTTAPTTTPEVDAPATTTTTIAPGTPTTEPKHSDEGPEPGSESDD
jgi:hypothetical protein